jgi:undecaprenyl-diphosphatase
VAGTEWSCRRFVDAGHAACDDAAPDRRTSVTTSRRFALPYGLELGSVAVLGLAGGALFAFLKLAGEIREGDTHRFDEAILLALRQPGDLAEPIGPPWLKQVMTDLTALGGFTVLGLLTLVSIFYLLMDGKRRAAILLAVSIGGGTILSTLLKSGFDRPRPELVAHMVEVHTLSFPSGHAMLSAVTYLTLGVLLARLSPRRAVKAYVVGVAVLLTLLVGCSRVFLGVHWPTDVVGGWCVGAAWALLCWQVAVILQRRGELEHAGETSPGDADRTQGNRNGN